MWWERNQVDSREPGLVQRIQRLGRLGDAFCGLPNQLTQNWGASSYLKFTSEFDQNIETNRNNAGSTSFSPQTGTFHYWWVRIEMSAATNKRTQLQKMSHNAQFKCLVLRWLPLRAESTESAGMRDSWLLGVAIPAGSGRDGTAP